MRRLAPTLVAVLALLGPAGPSGAGAADPPPAAATTRDRLLPAAQLVYSVDFDEISKIDKEMPGAPQDAAFSPDGRFLAVGGKTKVTRFFDARTGKFIIQQPVRHLPLGGHRAIAWTEDSRYCFATGSDHVIWMWSPALNFGCDRALRGGIPNETICIDYNPRTKMLLSGGSTGSLQLREVFRTPIGTGKGVMGAGDRSVGPPMAAYSVSEAEAGGHSKNVLDVSWHPSGERFACGSWMALQIFDAREFGPVMAPGTVMSKNWWGAIFPTMRDVPIRALKIIKEFPVPSDGDETGKLIRRVAWSPNGRILAVGLGVGKENAHDGRHKFPVPILLYDTSTWQVVRQWMAHPTRVYALEWSPDGSVLASGGGNEAAFWDPNTGRKLLSITDAKDEVSGVSWSSSGEWVVVCPGSERHDSPGPTFKFPGKDRLARIYKIVKGEASAPGPARGGPPQIAKVDPPKPTLVPTPPLPPNPTIVPPKPKPPTPVVGPPPPTPILAPPAWAPPPPTPPPKPVEPPLPPPPKVPPPAQAFADAGQLETQGKWSDARAAYEKVAELFPNTPEAGRAAEAIARLWKEHGPELLEGMLKAP